MLISRRVGKRSATHHDCKVWFWWVALRLPTLQKRQISSSQPIHTTQAPFGGQADDRDQKIERVVPERRRPGLGNRGVPGGKSRDECGKILAVDDFSFGLGGQS